jgi:NAD(P)-dependent dehydrogenase (short-subunit alcohol dehydrogenase family)
MTFDRHSTAADVVAEHDLTGTEAIVTGGTSGLGAETATALATAGARVVLAGRDPARGAATAARLREETGNRAVEFETLDLASLASVDAFTRRYLATSRPLHLLINNAGIMATPLTYTTDGFESQFGTNHLGHFALTAGLHPALLAAGGARVVALTSRAYRRGDVDFDDPGYRHHRYDPWQAYGRSKTANALFAVGLTSRHARTGITANAVMPGAIMTDLQRHVPHQDLADMNWADVGGSPLTPDGWKSVAEGAATTVWAAVAPELAGVGGRYLEDCAIAEPWPVDDDPPIGHYLPYALDPDHADRLWTLSEKLLAG